MDRSKGRPNKGKSRFFNKGNQLWRLRRPKDNCDDSSLDVPGLWCRRLDAELFRKVTVSDKNGMIYGPEQEGKIGPAKFLRHF